jgi:HPt (histidine-containing phosphotransfer) domain-containing protein
MIDWTRIDELRSEIGEEGLAEVVEIFLEEVEEALARLAALPGGADRAACLHFLKGSGLNLGFVEFGATCRRAEIDPADASDAEIAGAFHAARTLLIARLDSPAA